MAERPRIQLPLKLGDKLVETLGLLLLGILWGQVLQAYGQLPETIPIHFNLASEPDNYGSKATLFALPVIGTMLFAALSLLNRYPHIFNFPVEVTEQNAERLYRLGTRLIRYIKTILLLIFNGIVWHIVRAAGGGEAGLSNWFLPGMLALLLLPVVYVTIMSKRA